MDRENLCLLIKRLNPREMVEALNNLENIALLFESVRVYHILVEALLNRQTDGDESSEVYAKTATQMVYLLSTHGLDINEQDENGDTALLCYLKAAAHSVPVSDDLVVAFLRCGTDACLKNKDGEDILQYILQRDELPKQIRARVLEYMPGVWRAVDSDDACTVRRLINQWCHIKLVKDGMSVLQLAHSKGTENIIRVISGIGPSMDVAHSVLAGDCVAVKKILQTGCHININLKNMAEMGATPLYFAMCNNDIDMIELLLKHGARLDCGMQGENQMELPLYFAALSHRPCIDTHTLKYTIPKKPVPLDQLYYKGKNVIFYCIEHQVDVQLFHDILKTCSAHVLTQRIEGNINAREFAVLNERECYVTTIDVVVADWCTQEDLSTHRNTLCLHGYPFVLPLAVEDTTLSDKLVEYMQLAEEFEDFKLQLQEATICGNANIVRKMLNTKSWLEKGLDVCLADSRVCGDGQHLLHKAVLQGHVDVVTEIVQYVLHNTKRKLDSFRDQYFRTALHYLYGTESCSKTLTCILEDSGMSQYSMDKDGRSPLAFKDRRGLKEMKDLLDYHRRQDFTEPEPDPWSVNLPLPITGYLKQCLHEHHVKKRQGKAVYDKEKGKAVYDREKGKAVYEREKGKAVYDRNREKKEFNKQTKSVYERAIGDFYKKYSITDQSGLPASSYQMANQTELHAHNSHKLHTVVSVNPKNSGSFRSDVFHGSKFSSILNEDGSGTFQDVSDFSSDGGSLYEDYEGDQSDLESEDDDKTNPNRYCNIL